MHLTVGKKIFLGFAVALAAIGVIAWESYRTTNRYLETYSWVDHTYRVLETLSALSTDLAEMEGRRQDFIATRNEASLAAHRNAASRAEADLQRLGGLTQDNPEEERRAKDLQSMILRRRAADATAALKDSEDNAPVGPIWALIGQMNNQEQRLLDERAQNSAGQATRTRSFIVIGSFVALLLAAVAGLVIYRDFRLRNRAEELQREAEARYREIFENALEGIFQSTLAGKFLAANPALARLFGHESPAELIASTEDIGSQIYAIRSDREDVKTRLLRDGEIKGMELNLRRKDGSPVWVSMNSRIVKDPSGKPLYLEGALRDITDEKRAQEERARLSRHNDLLLQSTGEGIYGADLDGRCTFVNESALRMLGYPASELMGRRTHELIHDRHADGSPYPRSECRIAAAARTGETCRVDTEVMWRKNGESFPVEYTASPIIEDGVVRGTVITFFDISNRHALEKELLEKNRELLEQNRRVEEANRLKSEFLANMSHELRTPLNGIIGFSELMVDEKVGPISDAHREFLTDILNSARHLLQLINDVLDLSKIEAGKMEFRPTNASVPKLAAEARDVLRSVSAAKKVCVDVEIAGVDQVFIDVGKFKQVLYNYLSNALKFSPEGGRVTVRVGPDASGFFLLEVEDSGIGIKAEDIPKLFVEFRQLDEGAAKKYSGTGLGLALTKKIVQAQGGRVGVRSTPGKGSIFWAVMPLRHAVQSEDVVRFGAPTEPPSVRRGKVLIVEDDPASLRIMETLLERRGYQPICEPTVGGALRAVENDRPQAIVLDLMLHGLSGFDFIERFRRLPGGETVPIVVWTAKELSSAEQHSLQYLVQAIVLKDSGSVYPLLDALKPFLPGIEEQSAAEGVR